MRVDPPIVKAAKEYAERHGHEGVSGAIREAARKEFKRDGLL